MKSLARESLKGWLTANNVNPDLAENTANSCSELIENTIKYSVENETISVLIALNKPDILIETINVSDEEQKEKLLRYYDNLQSSSKNLSDLFLEKLQHCTTLVKSQLGLIKIILETGGKVELLEVEKNNIVHVKLSIKIQDHNSKVRIQDTK